jgi:hypothetical protein
MATAINEAFPVVGTTGQLDIGGKAVASGASVSSIIRRGTGAEITNLLPYSEDLTQWSAWAGTSTKTATTVTDTDAANTSSVYKMATVPNNTATYTVQGIVGKGASNIVYIMAVFDGGTVGHLFVLGIDTTTGGFTFYDNNLASTVSGASVIDLGSLGWGFTFPITNTGAGNTGLYVCAGPALASSLTPGTIPTSVNSLTGTATMTKFMVTLGNNGWQTYIPNLGTTTTAYDSSPGTVQRTNLWAYSDDCTQFGADLGTFTSTKTTITDTDVAVTSCAWGNTNSTPANDSLSYVMSCIIAKNAPNIPVVSVALTGGAQTKHALALDTVTGTFVCWDSGLGSLCNDQAVVVDLGSNGWGVAVKLTNNSSGNTDLGMEMYPAWRNNLTAGAIPTAVASFTGAVGLSGIMVEKTSDLSFKPRIPTNGSAVTVYESTLVPASSRTNLLLGSVLAGTGTTPTQFTYYNGGGSSAPAASSYGSADGAQAWAFTATAGRQILYQTVALAASQTYCLSVLVESVTGTVQATGVITGLDGTYPAGATFGYPVCSANPSGGSGGTIQPGVLLHTITTSTTSGNCELRFGLGCGSTATGAVQFSRPQLEVGTTRTNFIPTTTAAVTVYGRTNQAGPSENLQFGFDGGFYNAAGLASVTSGHTAPNGSPTMCRIVEDSSTGYHDIEQDYSGRITYGAVHYFSCWVSKASTRWLGVYLGTGSSFGGDPSFQFNPATGSLGSTSWFTGLTVSDCGSHWFIHGETSVAATLAADLSIILLLMVDDTTNSYTGNGTSFIEVWGLYFSDTDGAYIPNTNMLLGSELAGSGTTPDQFTYDYITGGSSSNAVSSYGNADGAQAWIFSVAVGQLQRLHQTITLVASTTYCVSVLIESVTGTINLSNIMYAYSYPTGTTFNYPVCPANPSGGSSSSITTGVLIFTIATSTTSGSCELRFGAGIRDGTVTSTVQFSRPRVDIGTTRSSIYGVTRLKYQETNFDYSYTTAGVVTMGIPGGTYFWNGSAGSYNATQMLMMFF